jgi:hypothetical protein
MSGFPLSRAGGLFRRAGCVACGQAGDAAQGGETVAGSRPLAADRLDAGVAHGPAKDGGDDDGIVGIAQDRDEVGPQVEGECDVGQQQREPCPDPARQAAVR